MIYRFCLWYDTFIMTEDFQTIIEHISEQDIRYKEDAYEFVMEALSLTQKKMKCARHITSEELLQGMKQLLMKKYGPMTMTVLEYWGVKTTEDFGNIVFNLVDNKVLSKTEEDDIEMFKNAYDLKEVFEHGYRKQLNKRISRMR